MVKYQFVDSKAEKDIISELSIMPQDDAICSLIIFSNEKVTKVYAMNGLLMFFSDRHTLRKAHSWSGKDFYDFKTAKQKYNQQYDEAFISVFNFGNDTYFAEHNEKLTIKEIEAIHKFVKEQMCGEC